MDDTASAMNVTSDWSPIFDVIIVDKNTGAVKLSVKHGLVVDCSDTPYKFYLRAERCEDFSLSDRYVIF